VPEAVVFDLDGVLVDSEQRWDAARRGLADEAGLPWPEGATRAMLGMSAPEWSAYMHDAIGVPIQPAEIDRAVVERVLAGYEQELPLLPDAVPAVRRVAERWPLGLASSSNRPVIDLVLERMGVSALFGATVSSEEVARGKPAPDVYREAAGRLGVDPAHCAAVEDSTNGIRSAAAAGMTVIAVPNAAFPPAGDALALATAVLGDLRELTAAVVESLDA
jgi:HAD superfamily hydrolase (TIGR01509 family)